MVMGGDSYSADRRFKSQHRILDGHISHIFVVKIVFMFVCKRPKLEDKRGRGWPILKNNGQTTLVQRNICM